MTLRSFLSSIRVPFRQPGRAGRSQLLQLVIANDAWDMFREEFRDKRQLTDLIGSIVYVRNDSAHFTSIPERELQRCKLATEDLKR